MPSARHQDNEGLCACHAGQSSTLDAQAWLSGRETNTGQFGAAAQQRVSGAAIFIELPASAG
jgi:hypothetical protein